MLLTYSDLVKSNQDRQRVLDNQTKTARMKFTYRYNRETLCRKQKLLKGNPTVF